MIAWGSGAGRILNKLDRQYAKEYIIIIHHDIYRDLIIEK